MPKAIQYTQGQHFPNTRLTFIKEIERINPKVRRANFLCECGNTIDLAIAWVVHLNSTSCGCYKSEITSQSNTKHSHAIRNKKSGTYRSWQAMHQRVLVNPNYTHVSVCDRWSGEQGFLHFFEDMGERPESHTIERDDNSKGYEPSNCRWATKHEQAQNTSQTVHIVIEGESHSINEWCRIKGIGYHVIKQRRARGMTLEQAITTPINTSKQGRRKL